MHLIAGDKKPTLKELQRNVIKTYAIYWYHIGIELDVYDATIEKDYQECEIRLRKTLQTWLDSTPPATWKMLEVAITNVIRAEKHLKPVDDIYGICFI